MSKQADQVISKAEKFSVSEPSYAATLLANFSRQASSSDLVKIKSSLLSLNLMSRVRLVNGCFVVGAGK